MNVKIVSLIKIIQFNVMKNYAKKKYLKPSFSY